MKTDAVAPAIDRLFRTYCTYLRNEGPDTLVHLLTAMHSLDEKVNAAYGRLFFDIEEYLVLKALRNHIVHSGEVPHIVSAKAPKGITFVTDLLSACLVGLPDCQAAIAGIKSKEHRDSAEAAFKATALIYQDKVVDLNPCIFNGVVKMYEVLLERGEEGVGDEYVKFAGQYDWETEEGHSHYVSGGVGLHAADMDNYQDWVVGQYEEKPA